jgi:hypothetical protein
MAENFVSNVNEEKVSKILVVFDINGTLLTRIKKFQVNPESSHLISGTICMRPHATELAEFLNENNIDYAFWTTQGEKKAEEAFECLKQFGFINSKFSWKSDMCVKRCIKDLRVVQENFPEYNKNNIIIVDDSDHKIVDKDRFIKITSFNIYNLANDDGLIILHDYIKRLFKSLNQKNFDDCCLFMRKNPFSFF